jgi:hypothetical protein
LWFGNVINTAPAQIWLIKRVDGTQSARKFNLPLASSGFHMHMVELGE